MVYIAVGLLCDLRWTSPEYSYPAFSDTVSSLTPVVASVFTLFGAVGIWSWERYRQSARLGIDNLGDAHDDYGEIAEWLEGQISTVRQSEKQAVFRLVEAIAEFRLTLATMTVGWNPDTDGKNWSESSTKFLDSRDKLLSELNPLQADTRWQKRFRSLQIAARKTRDGITDVSYASTYRQLTARIFYSVGFGFGLTLALMVATAVAYHLEAKYFSETNTGDWSLLPTTLLLINVCAVLIAKPALALWDVWSMHRSTDERVQQEARADYKKFSS